MNKMGKLWNFVELVTSTYIIVLIIDRLMTWLSGKTLRYYGETKC